MAIEISEKIRFYGKEAIEDRLNVATIEDRNNIPLNERYNGMITTVRSEGKRYELLFDGDFEGLNETEKDAFLGNNDNWKITNATLESDIVTVVTRSWNRDGKLSFKAILDDDIGIQEWEAARIYVIPHNDGYYHGEMSPMSYVAKTHRFLKDDTEESEEKGNIEAGELSVLKIRNDVPLKILKLGASDYEYQGVIVDFLVVGENEHGDMMERVSQKGIYASGAIRSPFLRGDQSVTIGSTDGHGGFSNPALIFEWLHTVGDSDAKIFLAEGSASPGGGKLIYSANGGHVFEGSITASGDITAFSDKRLKANIKPITKALDKIKKIEGVSYTRKDQADKKKKHIGVIAQDLLEVVPEVVQVPDKPEGMHSVDYSKLTALLIEGIKEQQKEIELLKGEINLMKGGK